MSFHGNGCRPGPLWEASGAGWCGAWQAVGDDWLHVRCNNELQAQAESRHPVPGPSMGRPPRIGRRLRISSAPNATSSGRAKNRASGQP